jgi:hypothetical protein
MKTEQINKTYAYSTYNNRFKRTASCKQYLDIYNNIMEPG